MIDLEQIKQEAIQEIISEDETLEIISFEISIEDNQVKVVAIMNNGFIHIKYYGI